MLVTDALPGAPSTEILPDVDRPPQSVAALPASSPVAGRLTAVVLPALGVLAGLIYRRTFVELAAVWDIDPNYSHGYAVPLACLWFARLAWQKHGGIVRRGVPTSTFSTGLANTMFGLGLHVVAYVIGSLLLDVLSMVFVLRGLTLCLGGRATYDAYGFAALFLLFMAPLPVSWYQPPAVWMQSVVGGFSTWLLNVCGVSAFREGYRIHLSGYSMEVGEACSGLRQLTAIVALAAAAGHLANRGRWFGWILAAASLPIAITANSLRIVLTGVSMLWFGPAWAEGIYHTGEGLLLALVAAGMLVGTAWLLAQWIDHRRLADPGDAA